jgi:hypothetical protein
MCAIVCKIPEEVAVLTLEAVRPDFIGFTLGNYQER